MSDVLTAYHEAGHLVMGVILGAQIRSATIMAEYAEDDAIRFGSCKLAWSMERTTKRQHAERQIRTALAGPVAEQIYDGNDSVIRIRAESSMDWIYASSYAETFIDEAVKRTNFLVAVAEEIRDLFRQDDIWVAVASTADELLAHDFLEGDALQPNVEFWLGRCG